jgi:glycosyltransferase involved in cell wall biosynthesis
VRILYLTNGFPFPLTSGYLRHYFLIRELARYHKITLLSVVGPGYVPQHAEAMSPYVERVRTFVAARRGGSRLRKVTERLRSAGRGRAEMRAMRAAVEEEVKSTCYDAVVLSGKPTYDAIAGLALPPIVADMCDATSMRLRGQMPYVNLVRRAVLWLDARYVMRAERAILDKTDRVLFASARDRTAIVGGPTPRASVVPNGVDTAFWKRSSPTLGTNTMIFTGAMNYPPNVDAAMFLIEQILPRVRRTVPDARALIVGHSPPPSLVNAGTLPGVTVTGFVEDVRPYLEQATVFVAPVRFAAGIQNKLLEALAMELPAVASRLAADGLRMEDGSWPPVQTADTADEYADAVCRQFVERGSDSRPAPEGRAYVQSQFNWTLNGEKLKGIIEAAVRDNAQAQVA